jgi:hypothetical protein
VKFIIQEDPKKLFADMSEKVIEMSKDLEITPTSSGIDYDKELIDNTMMRIDFLETSMLNIIQNTFSIIAKQKESK